MQKFRTTRVERPGTGHSPAKKRRNYPFFRYFIILLVNIKVSILFMLIQLTPYQKIRLLHLGLLIFVIAAWLTGEGAESYEEIEKINQFGFTLHKWLGMSVVFFIYLRIFYGLVGPKIFRLSQFFSYSRDHLLLIGQDFLNLVRLKLPSSPLHQGLIGTIKFFGLFLFTWMATTGTIMFTLLEPGKEATGKIDFVMELHKIGEQLIPIYLVLHVGMVIFYAIKGRDLWRKMFFLR